LERGQIPFYLNKLGIILPKDALCQIPLEKGYPLRLNNLKFPTPKDDLCQVWLKLAPWFWKRGLLNDPTPFFHFCDYLPFEDDLALYLKNPESPSPKDNLYQV
jgi:hypothetical protein